jgi:PKD repeat protein
MRARHRRSRNTIVTGFACVGLGLLGCSKDSNGTGPDGENVMPTAAFTSACTDLSCTFTDLSSDDDGHVTAYAWEFGDGQGASSKNPSHSFAGAGQFSVKLTVTDDRSGQGSLTKQVSVTAHVNGAPTADFSVNCSSLDCTFSDLSTDADGTVVGWAWEFGDNGSASGKNPPVHHYDATARTIYSAKLTVTDDQGLTSSKTAEITVSPPATFQCEDAPGTGHFAACDLVLEEAASVTIKLESRSCDAHGNKFQIISPITETLFSDGCYAPGVGAAFNLDNGTVFPAGTHLQAQVMSGATNQQTAPALHVTGTYPSWTVSFDDGVGGPGEPDFNDLVFKVTANP